MARKNVFTSWLGKYSLRTKLIVIFLSVNLLSIITVALLTNSRASATLTDSAGEGVRRLAETQATDIGYLLATQVEKLQVLGFNRTLQQRVKTVNGTYQGDSQATRAEIEQLDRQWIVAKDDDPLIQGRLNNDVARELKEFTANFPDQPEVFITDKYGALVATTNRTSDYDQADETWWQEAFNEGQGAVYIGVPEFDESSGKVATIIAVPLVSSISREVIGVLRTTYEIGAIAAVLEGGTLGQTGRSDLHLPGNLELRIDQAELEPADFDPRALAPTSQLGAVFVEATHDGIDSLIGIAPVVLNREKGTPIDLGWAVVAFQERQEALALVREQNLTTFFLSLVIAAASIGIGLVVAQQLTAPIKRLTETAQQIAGGDLSVQAQVEGSDEVGTLAVAFNSMTGQLRENIDTLEERVTERTRQLETVVEISRRLVSILDLSDLARQVVTLTKETFDYYHVHIYLLDEVGDTLLMAEGYGQAGAEMKRQGHNIPLAAPQSLVARAGREGRVVIVGDTRSDPTWLPNPLLPDTRSEMAVPIMVGAEVVGVLDVQSDQLQGLTEEDEATLQILANQIGVAVRNANLFAETQQKLYDAQRLQRLYVSQTWQQLIAARKRTHFEVGQPATGETPTPEVEMALEQKRTVDMQVLTGSGTQVANGHGNGHQSNRTHRALATPLKLHNQIIGVLGLQDENPERQWTEDEIALIEAVGEQMSLAIENARLFDETRRHAWRDQLVSESTAKVWSSSDVEEVLKMAVAQLGSRLGASEVVIQLGTEDQK